MSNIKHNRAALFSIEGNSGSLAEYTLPKGIVSANSIIPAPVQAILQTQFKSVGLNFDISKIALNQDNRQTLQTLKQTVDLITNNANLLPQFARELKKAMKAATKMAEFNADMVKASLKEQAKIDEAQADILLAMAGYVAKRDRLQMKLERRAKIQERVHEARARYYDATWGKEAQLIDASWDSITEIAISSASVREHKMKERTERTKQNHAWAKGA